MSKQKRTDTERGYALLTGILGDERTGSLDKKLQRFDNARAWFSETASRAKQEGLKFSSVFLRLAKSLSTLLAKYYMLSVMGVFTITLSSILINVATVTNVLPLSIIATLGSIILGGLVLRHAYRELDTYRSRIKVLDAQISEKETILAGLEAELDVISELAKTPKTDTSSRAYAYSDTDANSTSKVKQNLSLYWFPFVVSAFQGLSLGMLILNYIPTISITSFLTVTTAPLTVLLACAAAGAAIGTFIFSRLSEQQQQAFNQFKGPTLSGGLLGYYLSFYALFLFSVPVFMPLNLPAIFICSVAATGFGAAYKWMYHREPVPPAEEVKYKEEINKALDQRIAARSRSLGIINSLSRVVTTINASANGNGISISNKNTHLETKSEQFIDKETEIFTSLSAEEAPPKTYKQGVLWQREHFDCSAHEFQEWLDKPSSEASADTPTYAL